AWRRRVRGREHGDDQVAPPERGVDPDGEPEQAEVHVVAGALGDEKAHAASARCCGGLQNIRGPGGRQSDSGRGCVARWLLYILSVRRTPRRTSERSTVMAQTTTNAAAKDPGEW